MPENVSAPGKLRGCVDLLDRVSHVHSGGYLERGHGEGLRGVTVSGESLEGRKGGKMQQAAKQESACET